MKSAGKAATAEKPAQAGARRSRRGSGGITLADVAKLAGVSPITASRALNSPDQVSPATLARVRDAVLRTGYVPNLLAGGLAANRSRLVAALVPTIAGPVFMETVQSLTEALAARGYQVMLGQSGYAESQEDALLEAIIGRRPDGIFLTGVMHSPAGRRRLIGAGIPVVETWDLTPTPIDMLVGFSHERIGAAVADFLIARGRHRIAVISGNDERALRRTRSLTARLHELGVSGAASTPLCLVPAPTTLGSGRSGLADLLARQPDTDAVVCSSDLLALGVLTEAQVRRIEVPQQLAVVGFGDLAFAADTAPALTTVRIDGTAIGRIAAQCIVDRAEGREVEMRIRDIGFSIVPRASA